MITVVIIGYNNYWHLRKCLESVISQIDIRLEIIYIDNNSNDESVEYIDKNYPQVRIVENNKNLGYGKAANLGIDLAKYDYVLILNPDMILEPSYIRRAMAELLRHDKAAGVGGKIYKYDFMSEVRTNIIDTIGLISLKGRQFIDGGAGVVDKGQFEISMEIFGVSGNCVLFRKLALIDARIEDEYFDEMFFMYKEDVDICWRLRLLGWIFVYTPSAIAYHVRGTGVQDRTNILGIISARKKLNRAQKYYSFKNHQLLLVKNELIAASKKGLIYIAIREIAMLFWILIMEPYNLRVILELCKQLPLALGKREVIMKRKRILSDEIGPWLDRSVPNDI